MPAETHEQLFVVSPYEYVHPEMKAILEETGIDEEVIFRNLLSESSLLPIGRHPRRNADGSYDYGFAGVNSYYLRYFRDEFMGGRFNPRYFSHSFKFTARYLRRLYDQTGCLEKATLSYKTGTNRMHKAGKELKEIAKYIVRGS